MLDLQRQRALVCGATQGIGRACAVALANRGASVILLARNPDTLAEVLDTLPVHGDASHGWLAADFADPMGVAQTVEAWLPEGGPVTILVNNTGGPPSGPALTAEPGDFLAAFGSHLLVNQLLVQAVFPGMRDAGYGRVINIISTSVKQPIPGLGVSNTTRGAVASWSKTLATELGPHGITVNNVLPGATRTVRLESLVNAKAQRLGTDVETVERAMQEEIPLRRFAHPEEIAAAVVFLASPEGSYINGINLPVDGGRLACL